jgi:hypothetical protein
LAHGFENSNDDYRAKSRDDRSDGEGSDEGREDRRTHWKQTLSVSLKQTRDF